MTSRALRTAAPLTLLFALPLTARLTAQDLTVQAVTNASVLARTGTQGDLQTIKAGSKVSVDEKQFEQVLFPVPGATATSSGGRAGLGLRAGTSPLEIVPGRGFLIGLNAIFLHMGSATGDGTVATSADASASTAKPGPVSFLVTFRQPASVTGELVVSWAGLGGSNSHWTASVDIGNDNTVELAADSTKDTSKIVGFPVTFAGGPVAVKVTLSGTASNAPAVLFNQFQSLRLSLVRKGSCALVSYGKPCGGASMNAGMLTLGKKSVLSTKLSGAASGGFFIRVFGESRTALALPGGCQLLAEPAVLDLRRADANGEFVESFLLPTYYNFTLTMQYLPFTLSGNQIVLSATEAWEMRCSGF